MNTSGLSMASMPESDARKIIPEPTGLEPDKLAATLRNKNRP
jgi:hypothetical protein